MEQLHIYIAPEFTEFYHTKQGHLTPVHFHLEADEKGELIGGYINAIDLVVVLGYREYNKAWDKLKSQYSFHIEYSLTFGSGDEVSFKEDFLTYNQARMLIEKSNRLGAREKQRLLNFLLGSIQC